MNKVSKDNFTQEKYKYGFVTEIESEKIPKGLNEEVIRLISKKKNEPEWMLDWRLSAFLLKVLICQYHQNHKQIYLLLM